MMHRFDRLKCQVAVQQTRRAASAGGGVIHASAPEGLEGDLRSHCGAVAGVSVRVCMR